MKLTPLKIFLILLLSVLIPFIFIAASVFAVSPVYDETFLGELAANYELLKKTDEPKIVVIGGSSAAFGLDSTLIGEAVGRPVVNFGLYATLGTKMMLDLSRANIGKGDTVILAPELDEQTLSLYFNATSAWQAIDSNPSMLLRVGFRNGSDLLGGVVEYLGKKYEYSLAGRKVTQTGVYSRSSFNESGDIVYPRPYNVMTFGYDRSTEIRLEPDIFSEEFIDYVNRYISWARRRGAEVYFAFCPMNRDALAPGTTDDSVYEFVEFIEENLDCRVIGNPWESILDSGYFYDTNYHLNDAGVKVHSETLANDILRTEGATYALMLDLPDPPGKKPESTEPVGPDWEEDPNEKYFEFGEINGLLSVTGVSEEGKSQTVLRIPDTYQGRKVLVLGGNGAAVFAECRALTQVVIGEGLANIQDGAFSGCPSLRSILMDREDAESLEASTELFDGVSDEVLILFYTETALDNFSVGYWWAYHAPRMALAKN
ncbi:MAG: hypothetical protein ILO42_08900 [Clostridia bacterium]|nr:hypothetical protein [Clostridia bacterium]